MTRRLYKKYKKMASILYLLEIDIALANSADPPSTRTLKQHRKLRNSYNRFRNRPAYLDRLYAECLADLDEEDTDRADVQQAVRT